ncbi:hypothetical protein [Actinoplanes missouriensis]|uniref:hypothetical protein n=1 Tax=Actinoplanes missouriensis TaxID=1866 RepID=UPI00030C926B|nr:hypothetical protein [Actinoplanes missouriensis]
MRLERALCAVVLVALVGGCTSDDKEPTFSEPAQSSSAAPVGSAPAWTEPAAYSYVLTRGCDPNAPLGTYRATVSGGAVSTAERVGAPAASPSASAEVDLGPVTGQEGEEIEVPTLGQLTEMARTATEDGAEVATEYDATDGHPVKVSINVTDTPDGAECWTVSDYQV